MEIAIAAGVGAPFVGPLSNGCVRGPEALLVVTKEAHLQDALVPLQPERDTPIVAQGLRLHPVVDRTPGRGRGRTLLRLVALGPQPSPGARKNVAFLALAHPLDPALHHVVEVHPPLGIGGLVVILLAGAVALSEEKHLREIVLPPVSQARICPSPTDPQSRFYHMYTPITSLTIRWYLLQKLNALY